MTINPGTLPHPTEPIHRRRPRPTRDTVVLAAWTLLLTAAGAFLTAGWWA